VLGLLVAVPSMVGYNALVNRIRGMVVRLDNFASELSAAWTAPLWIIASATSRCPA
jgi:biopolymer transport protein ExbB/TolQ